MSQIPKVRWDECGHVFSMAISSAITVSTGRARGGPADTLAFESAGAEVLQEKRKACQCCSTKSKTLAWISF